MEVRNGRDYLIYRRTEQSYRTACLDEMECLAIPILINGNVQYFDFRCSDVYCNYHFCRITSLGYETVLDECFAVVQTDMPENWVTQAIEKLHDLINSNRFKP